MDTEELLYSFYRSSFPRLLRISFSPQIMRDYGSLEKYLESALSPRSARTVLELLALYQQDTSPAVKSEPLLAFLKAKVNLRPSSLVDFGCGTGYTIRHLVARIDSLQRVRGIDSDAFALPVGSLTPPNCTCVVSWHENLSEASIPTESCDLILLIHSLHHMTSHAQGETIDMLRDLLRVGGLLYIYEDSWSEDISVPSGLLHLLDSTFAGLSATEKVELFKLNDFWSNNWSYGRSLDNNENSYRPLEHWAEVLIAKKFQLEASGVIGFDTRRLHGVPSTWIIAAK